MLQAVRGSSTGIRLDLNSVLVVRLSHSATFSRLLNFSEPQCPHLQNGLCSRSGALSLMSDVQQPLKVVMVILNWCVVFQTNPIF